MLPGKHFRRVKQTTTAWLLTHPLHVQEVSSVSSTTEETSRCTGVLSHVSCCGQRLWVTCYRKIKHLTEVQRAATSHIIHIYHCRPLNGYVFPQSQNKNTVMNQTRIQQFGITARSWVLTKQRTVTNSFEVSSEIQVTGICSVYFL